MPGELPGPYLAPTSTPAEPNDLAGFGYLAPSGPYLDPTADKARKETAC